MNDRNNSVPHPFYEETLESKPIFQGRIISLQVDTVRLPNGETATREIVRHPGAVAVVALIDNKMLVVEQFRKPLEKAQVEIPAGKLDAGEEPVAAALRSWRKKRGTAREASNICSLSPHRRDSRKRSFTYTSPTIWSKVTCTWMRKSF